MTTAATMRLERIQRLMRELEYEVTRGIMEREIEPDIHLSKEFPCPGRGMGTAFLDIHVYPATQFTGKPNQTRGPRLRVVGNDKGEVNG